MKTIDETIENYLISTIIGAYKYKKHWMKKGFDEDSAIEKSVKYAIGQMKSGTGYTFNWEDVENMFREISVIATSFADLCKKMNISS